MPQGYSQFDTFMRKAGAIKHDLRCYDDTIEFIAQVRDQALLKKRIEKAFPSGASSAAFRKLLKVSLYPYQREGTLFAAKAGRSLIADDMGLGKTIQAIAAVEILAGTVGLERVLIISPTSLKHQWSLWRPCRQHRYPLTGWAAHSKPMMNTGHMSRHSATSTTSGYLVSSWKRQLTGSITFSMSAARRGCRIFR